MSLLHAAAPYRRDDRAALRIPVVMPLVEVTVGAEGVLDVRLDQEPYAADGALGREDLERVLKEIAAELGTPLRVEVRELDGTRFADFVSPPASNPARGVAKLRSLPTGRPGLGEVTGDGFNPNEQVTIAVVVAHQNADIDGTTCLRLPPALLAAHPGLVMLIGQTSGTVIVSGSPA